MEPQQQTTSNPIEAMRRVLRGIVLLIANQDEARAEKQTAAIDELDDTRLAAVAQEALSNLARAKKYYDNVETGLSDMRKELERIRTEHRQDERALFEAEKAVKERDDIAAKYKELQKQIDPEKHQLELMYAIDEATAKLKDEHAALRRDLGQRMTEVNELKASKKRLREAMDRLANKV